MEEEWVQGKSRRCSVTGALCSKRTWGGTSWMECGTEKKLHNPQDQHFWGERILPLRTLWNFVCCQGKRIRICIKTRCTTGKIITVCKSVHSSVKRNKRKIHKQKISKVIWNEPSEQGGPLSASRLGRKKAPTFSLPELVSRCCVSGGLCRG